ncbi:hypothetical protein [Actinoplanes couchii]|uniref:DUF916 domain-containing protein n=1 Tax=Actinoplanes couchii TaxID=403638 RepID=A0ABQ3XHA1_9ACTN|nr:hypothetical protein [Actinoplanes couchii]MDR6320641.1 hypothetical protein [Actinoplanes couchii]GID57873.1 hypothetical protein Aco03nite_062770 [Actinoplanes couchii]
MRRAAAVLAATTLLFPAPPAAPAAAAPATVTWTVQPATAAGPDGRRWIEQTLDPGQRLTEHLAVRNLGDTPAVFTLSAADGYLTAKGRFNMLPSDRASTDGGTWIEVPPTVTVEPGKTAVVPFTITAPPGALPGDHPAGIAASIAGTRGTVQVESRVGFRVLLRASGTLQPSLATDQVRSSYARSWLPWRPGTLRVSYQLTNTGNTRLTVTSKIGSATTDLGELLPGGARPVDAEVDGVWSFGRVRSTVALLPTVPGEPTPREPSTLTVTTWAMPWPQLLTLLAAALLLYAWRLRRRHLATMLEKAREEGRRSAV